MKKPVRTIMEGQAKEAFAELNRIVGEQLAQGMQNSDEIQLLNSIRQKSELIKQKPILRRQHQETTHSKNA